jgi:hypothetical protein
MDTSTLRKRVHVRHRHTNKTQGYLMGKQISPADKWLRHSEDHGHSWSQEGGPSGYKETTLFRQWKDKLKQLERHQYLPAEKHPSLLLRFYDTYIYYIYI